MNRREFVRKGIALPLAINGTFLCLPKSANAYFPLIARVMVGGFIRKPAVQSATRVIASRTPVSSKIASSGAIARQNGTRQFLNKRVRTSLGISAGLSVSVSPAVFALAQKHNAEAIWVKTGHANNFYMIFTNSSGQKIDGNLSLFIRDVERDEITTQLRAGTLSVPASSKTAFRFEIAELPYTGVIKIQADSTMNQLGIVDSGNIVIASASEVFFEDN